MEMAKFRVKPVLDGVITCRVEPAPVSKMRQSRRDSTGMILRAALTSFSAAVEVD